MSRWATEVEAEDERQAFLDMVRDWTLAAMRMEGVLISDSEKTNFPLDTIPMPAPRYAVQQQQQSQPDALEKKE